MPRVRFLFDNRYAAAGTALTPSSTSSSLPAAASQNPDRNYIFRSGTVSVAVTLDIDLGSVQAITACAVANLRIFAGGALELYHRGDGGAPGAATLVATLPAENATRRTAHVTFASQSHRHWQLKWTNPGTVSSYVELGYAFLGTYLEPSVNYTAPSESPIGNDSTITRAPSGGRSVVQWPWFDSRELVFTYLPTADVVTLETMARTIGLGTPMFVVLDDTLAWTTLLAFLAGSLGRREEDTYGRWTLTVPIEEARVSA